MIDSRSTKIHRLLQRPESLVERQVAHLPLVGGVVILVNARSQRLVNGDQSDVGDADRVEEELEIRRSPLQRFVSERETRFVVKGRGKFDVRKAGAYGS